MTESEVFEVRKNSQLAERQYEQLDDALVPVVRDKLTVFDDLADFEVDIGAMQIAYDELSDMGEAAISMDGDVVSPDEVDRTQSTSLIPVQHQEYVLKWRYMAASMRAGQDLDTSGARQSGEIVAQKVEDMILNGYSPFGISGMISAAGNTRSGSTWATKSNIYTDLNEAFGLLEDDKYTGPYLLYVASQEWKNLRQRDSINGEWWRNIIDDLPEIEAIKHVPNLPDGTALLYENDQAWIDTPVGQGMTTVPIDESNARKTVMQTYMASGLRIKKPNAICEINGI